MTKVKASKPFEAERFSMLPTRLRQVLVAIAVASSACAASAQTYTFTLLDTLGGSRSFAQAINNSGQVVGYSYLTGNTFRHATVWNGAAATDLGAPFGGDSFALSINNSGAIAGLDIGIRGTGTNVFRPMVWDGSGVSDLSLLQTPSPTPFGIAFAINDAGVVAGESRSSQGLGATVWNGSSVSYLNPTCCGPESLFEESHARAINNAGQVAGYASVGGIGVATVWNETSYTFLPTGGSLGSFAFGINDLGMVVGSVSATSSTNHGALWLDGTLIDLSILGGDSGSANDINNVGQIVGSSRLVGSQFSSASLWTSTSYVDLNDYLEPNMAAAGWHLETAVAINDNGWIIGDTVNTLTGQRQSYVLAPVPEPSPYALMLAGLGFVGFVARRRRTSAISQDRTA